MFQKIAKHRANDASNDVHRPLLAACDLPDPVVAKFKGEKGECEDCDEDLIIAGMIII